ncbi:MULTISPECIES: hypothetical protein [Trichocoleus]|uniref:Uncharacterized protein n=1 Tax=Trichocoleus desertorum GB2-A4 TaxID=2933944 RepID=A0ABV0JGN4_9CYAN|nr:hypothetical protein [Trichocoleus sp. FACHB-46]MBD1864824.1 hypothetical protein [Trichocoleus sp. FACHB-46]
MEIKHCLTTFYKHFHSDFWVGLPAQAWLDGMDLATHWAESWLQLSDNKQPYLQRGLDAAFRL